jgi:CheY-like chemotaxis protein
MPAAGKILVVDDDPAMRDLLRLHLANNGYEVLQAEDAVVAGHLVLKEKPDLLIVDVHMPYMDGFSVARRLRSDPQLRKIRVVALTGFGQQDDRRRTREAGFDDHLVKPVSPEDLRRLLA